MAKKITLPNKYFEIYENKNVALSNALIQAREKTSLLESKIELLAIYRMENNMRTRQKKDAKGRSYDVHYVELTSAEIKQLMGSRGGGIYEQIEAAAVMLKQKLYIYRDPVKGQFSMDSLYGEVSYADGRLDIEFNPATEYLFLNLKENYTKIRLDIAFRFNTNGGFQLYKLLKSYAYNLPDIDMELPQEEQEFIIKEYSLSELRLQLGYVDLNQPEIKKEGSKAHPDAEKMDALDKKPKYKRWVDFNSRVIQPGIKEINKISDIYIDSVDKVCAAHGKVSGVRIKFQKNKAYHENTKKALVSFDGSKKQHSGKKMLTEEELDDFIDMMSMEIPFNLKIKEYKSIAEAAGYDIEKVKVASEVVASYNKPIDNLVGFYLEAIKNEYQPPKKRAGKSTRNESEREHEDSYYDELERQLLQQ